MDNKIELTPMHVIDNPNTSCIYRIWFGRKYYIGKTKDLKLRIRSHKYDLERHIKNHQSNIINPYYESWVRHMIENKITSGFYEVLKLCKDEEERVLFEQMWFNSCCDDTDCLNYGFESKPYIPKPPKMGTPVKPKPVKVLKVKIPKKVTALSTPPKRMTNAQKLKQLKKTIAAISNQP